MLDRIQDRVPSRKTAAGGVPYADDLDLTGLEIAPDNLREAIVTKPEEWKAETASVSEFFDRIGASVPAELRRHLAAVMDSLNTNAAQRPAAS